MSSSSQGELSFCLKGTTRSQTAGEATFRRRLVRVYHHHVCRELWVQVALHNHAACNACKLYCYSGGALRGQPYICVPNSEEGRAFLQVAALIAWPCRPSGSRNNGAMETCLQTTCANLSRRYQVLERATSNQDAELRKLTRWQELIWWRYGLSQDKPTQTPAIRR